MGNGALGLVVCTRPDAVVLHFGHNSIWDIRIEEGHRDKVGTFRDIWSRILEEKDTFPSRPWYAEYREAMLSSYARNVYPRPFPASSVYLFFDRKGYEVLGHELDLSDGLLTVTFEEPDGRKIFLRVLVSMEEDRVLCETVDGSGATVPLFYRMRIVPNPPDYGLPEAEPLPDGFRQLLPANGYGGVVRPGVDKGFSLLYRLNGTADRRGLDTRLDETTSLDFGIAEGFFDQVEKAEKRPSRSFEDVHRRNAAVWAEYWERSGVRLRDEFLEHLWYTNTYFIRCVLSKTSRCPGLFGNWMCRNVGTAWHGDYHMNYNTQQPFWGLMAANRQELHFPYLRMVESLMPISEAWARDFYELDGAYFPHSAFPVPMTVNPYPLPGLGWEICETPWTVQSLWWHYTYTGDKNLLRERVYPPIRAAAAFLAGYMTREGANPDGDGEITDEDIYGYIDNADILPHLMEGTGNLQTKIDSEGVPYVNCLTGEYIEVAETVYNSFITNPAVYFAGSVAALFREGHALFAYELLATINSLRDMETMFSLLPLPKLNEQQENYVNPVNSVWCTAFCVPVTVTGDDLGRVGLIINVLSAFSEDTVTQVLYDQILGMKLIREENTLVMLDYSINYKQYCWANGYYEWNGPLGSYLGGYASNGSFALASTAQKFSKSIQKAIDKFLAQFDDLP